jgi:serpin B
MLMASVAGCGKDPMPAAPMLLRAEGVARVVPPSDAPVADVVAGIAAFGYDLAPTAGENWVASAASIAIALAMARAGANGPTATEIDEVFRFPASGLHEALNSLSRQLVTAELPPPRGQATTRAPGSPPGPTTVSIGNAVFPSSTFTINQAYLQLLAQQYGTGVYPVNFREPAAKQTIDAWARRQTADRIQKVFDEVDPDTAMVLANTVYLKGDWTTPFDPTLTGDEPFHRIDGSTIRVPTMHLQADLDYAEGDGWQAVELPYGDGSYAMRIILPTGTAVPRELLAPQVQSAVSAGLRSQRVDLALPRWDFATTVPLKDQLMKLGVVSAFDPDKADFSGMSPTPLYIANAIHRATITVDESGTEAAAVTALEMAPTSAPPPATVRLYADRPFAFAIVHVATATALFIGQVADPSAS